MRAKQQLYACTCESSKAEIYLTVFDIPSIPATDIPCAVPYGWVAPAYAKMPILLILSLFPRITTYMRFMNTPILIKFLILGLKIIQDIRIRHFLNN